MNDLKMTKLQHFFVSNVRVKKEMYDMAPISLGDLDEHALCKYVDKLNDTIIYIYGELKCIILDIFGEDSKIFKRVCELEQSAKNMFYSCGFDINKLQTFYQKYISNIEPSFIENVKKECVGYTFGGTRSVSMAFSVNEMLHFVHSYINNNDNILQSIPLIEQKYNELEYPISLRGVETPTFNKLFEMFPLNLCCGWADLVAINEKKMIMMIRDIGHALSIEITLNEDIARIEYFIPKLCNIEMINELPGVNKVNKDSVGATGVIETSLTNLPMVLYNFISKVPTDSDIVYEQGISI